MVGIPQYLQDKMNNKEIDATPRGRGPVEEGYYAMRLSGAEEDTKASGEGANLEFTITRGPNKGVEIKFQWFSYNESSAWKWMQLFDATGYTYDSEAEELIEGEDEFVAYVEKVVQTQGRRKGQFQNNVNEFRPINDDTLALLD